MCPKWWSWINPAVCDTETNHHVIMSQLYLTWDRMICVLKMDITYLGWQLAILVSGTWQVLNNFCVELKISPTIQRMCSSSSFPSWKRHPLFDQCYINVQNSCPWPQNRAKPISSHWDQSHGPWPCAVTATLAPDGVNSPSWKRQGPAKENTTPLAGAAPLKSFPGVKYVPWCCLCFCGHAFEVFLMEPILVYPWVCSPGSGPLFPLLLPFLFFLLLSPLLSSSLNLLFLFFFFFFLPWSQSLPSWPHKSEQKKREKQTQN